MTRLAAFALAALSFAVLSAPAHAARGVALEARTAGELARFCAANPRDPRGDAAINFCHGYAQGEVDTIFATAPRGRRPICFPHPTPTRSATLAEFVRWVRAEPARAELPAVTGLARFLEQRYPCR